MLMYTSAEVICFILFCHCYIDFFLLPVYHTKWYTIISWWILINSVWYCYMRNSAYWPISQWLVHGKRNVTRNFAYWPISRWPVHCKRNVMLYTRNFTYWTIARWPVHCKRIVMLYTKNIMWWPQYMALGTCWSYGCCLIIFCTTWWYQFWCVVWCI